ncbi:DUF2490 domain-containing protein [Methylobacterium oryzihabitans]|uniref:DUF2490 domain-containing protein n=1 Tax=Methylobacterium oryzihabitans TaxID=2499852 RepID=UPI001FE8D0BF|nr:DUF2490 domain-containing protein [Methylobacterium oryzihabitans]
MRGALPLASGLWLLASALPSGAQVVHDGQFWFNATIFGGVGSVAYFAEVQPRVGDGLSRLDQLILRPAIGWKLDDRLSLYQGYARVESTPLGGRAFGEDRSFQQVNWEIGRIGRLKLSSRTRFEQRWQTNGRDVGFRLREQVRAAYPLTDAKGSVSALGWVETFVALNDTDWGARAGFDRVRAFVGLEIPVVDRSTIELGYMNQTVNAPARVEMDHVLSLSVLYRP